MSLYVIRHGQTPLNTEGKFNGWADESLSEKGIMQAAGAGVNLHNKKIDLVYCSPFLRTRQTLYLLNLNPKIPVILDARLIERNEGVLMGTPITDEFLRDVYLSFYPKEFIEGLESINEVINRVYSLLSEIEKKHKDKNVLLVTHGFIGRIIYHYFSGNPNDKKNIFSEDSFQKNCEIREYEFGKKEKNSQGDLEPIQSPSL